MNRILTAIRLVVVVVGMTALSACVKPPPTENRETWELYQMQGSRIGYGQTQVRTELRQGQSVIRTESLNHLSIKRAGQTAEEDIHTVSLETLDGRLIRLETTITTGRSPIRTVGEVKNHRLELETHGSQHAAPVRSSIPWPDGCLGPFATEQTLVRRPMRPGERRTLKTFVTGFNQIAELELIAKQREDVALLKGHRELLRIDTITRLADGQKIESTVWTDDGGEILKTAQPMGLETYRCSKAEALEATEGAELDVLAGTTINLSRPLHHAHKTKQVQYLVRLNGGNPADVFPVGPSQAVRSIDPHTAEITVYAIRPGRPEGNREYPPDPPSEYDRLPNSFVQSDDPLIVAEAQQATSGESDPWRMAVALEHHVAEAVRQKNFTQAFDTASDVVRRREGDCTEHAVFLAALCRACSIPARVAIGLVYIESQQAFGYHAWTEVYVDDRWTPIDGTLSAGGIGAGHIKIGHSNLHGASAYSAFLPVVKVLGQLNIDLIEVE